jgi:hypothetical protein
MLPSDLEDISMKFLFAFVCLVNLSVVAVLWLAIFVRAWRQASPRIDETRAFLTRESSNIRRGVRMVEDRFRI